MWKVKRHGAAVFLDLGPRAVKIDGSRATDEAAPADAATIASGTNGDWFVGPGLEEFRAPDWKVRIEDGAATSRTGDGDMVPHLFSGIGAGRTGETAAARLIAYFEGKS